MCSRFTQEVLVYLKIYERLGDLLKENLKVFVSIFHFALLLLLLLIIIIIVINIFSHH